mgnify:CR=1 FL=1
MIKKFFIVLSIFFLSNLNSLLAEDIDRAKTTCEEIGFEKEPIFELLAAEIGF